MKVLILTDWHGKSFDIPPYNPELLIVLGDMSKEQIKELDRKYSCPKLGVLGNHDSWDNYEGTNFLHLHAKTYELKGISFAGFGGCPRVNSNTNPQYEEKEVENFTKSLDKVDIFLAHSNPSITEEYDENDSHRGFLSFNDYIIDRQPSFFFFGHNHECFFKKINGTNIIGIYPYLLFEI